MKTIYYAADSRGHFNHGWLDTYHSFSFADYYDPRRMRFGALRVVNDDTVAPGRGFGTHPHSNMEIVTIPLKGQLRHGDSMGHSETLSTGEIQVMSAGTGLRHSEMNGSGTESVEFLQIWIIPQQEDVQPRYQNARISELLKPNSLTTIVSPYPGGDGGLWIHQQAWVSMGVLKQDGMYEYHLKSASSYGVFVFVIEGEAEIDGVKLDRRDSLGVWDTDQFRIRVTSEQASLLLLEVPEL